MVKSSQPGVWPKSEPSENDEMNALDDSAINWGHDDKPQMANCDRSDSENQSLTNFNMGRNGNDKQKEDASHSDYKTDSDD